MRTGWAAVAVLAVVAASCGRDIDFSFPTPPSTVAPTTTSPPPDYAAVQLAGVPGGTTTTAPQIGPGRARISGRIVGPDGPVPGAMVRLERFVGDGVAAADVVSAADATWRLEGVHGGRYRVRAWRAPDLTTRQPVVLFLADSEPRTLDLRLERRQGTIVGAAVAPRTPVVGEPANLVVLVTSRTVDPQGIVRAEPVTGAQVTLQGSGDWRLRTSNPAVTDGDGEASWQLVCRTAGNQPLEVFVAPLAETFPLQLPACAERPPPTATTSTTIDDDDGDGDGGGDDDDGDGDDDDVVTTTSLPRR